MWRADDEALLNRLEDEICVARLFRHHAGDAPLPSLRAAGLVALVRRTPEGREAVGAALGGLVEPLRAVLGARRHDERPPELHHHLALFEAAIADAIAVSNPGEALEADVRSMAAWLALGEEKRYLRALGEAVAGADLPREELDRALAEAPFARIDELGQRARRGARERTARAQTALASLGAAAQAARRSGCSEDLARAAVARAERHRLAAIDEALAPLDEALTAASDRGEAVAQAPDLLEQVRRVWIWSGEDEGVERFAVERTSRIAWDAYRAPGWDPLRRLVTPMAPLVDRLAARIEADPSRVAYAGPCAQFLVFQADLEPQRAREMEILERALRICPAHRNARSRIAGRLCEAAIGLAEPVDKGRAPTAAEIEEAEAHLRRAETLFPAAEKLAEARRKVAHRRRPAGSP